ncbi:MAG: hypothetical protein JNK58_00425 [Phycisphaerae bacterium]|nr:hypothetical protein [Phycisphaerae bacterium]
MDDTPTHTIEKRFPCGQCGAAVEFSPGAQMLKCPFCGHENAVPQEPTAVEEQDFRATLDEMSGQDDHQDNLDVKCGACGAEVHGLGSRTALSCPYCNSNIVATAKSRRLIKPRALLPFRVTREQAERAFSDWLGGLWFAPSTLKRSAMSEGRLGGMYMPAWTFDCDATTSYTGMRGDAYYVSVPHTVMVNGRPQVRMRQERRIRWSPAAGTVFNRFDDVLVLASRSLPSEHARALEPWDLKALVPYSDDYLSGFAAESYQVDLPQGFEEARGEMRTVIEGTVRASIGGDEQRITSMNTRHDHITYKHILLPAWISAYRFKGKVFRFMVNARTGEVRGERPWSVPKIAAAVALGLLVVGIIVAVAVLNR